MKRIWSIFIVAVILLGVFSNTGFAATIHKSYAKGASEWAVPYITKMYVADICESYFLRDFQSNAKREEVTDLIMKAYSALGNSLCYDCESPFSDASLYTVTTAYNLGIVKGISETEFGADNPITREELACILNRTVNVCKKEIELTEIPEYKDWGSVSAWAEDSLKSMISIGVIKGISEDMIAPEGYVTKEQAITMVWRLYKYLGGEDYVLYEDTDMRILIDFGIVSEEEFEQIGSEITMRDFFKMILKFKYGSEDYTDDKLNTPIVRYDFSVDKLVVEDNWRGLNLSYSDQKILHDLTGGSFAVLDVDEVETIDLDAKVTRAESLFYMLRAVAGASGCVKGGVRYNQKSPTQIYQDAYKKGFITSPEVKSPDQPVSRLEVHLVLHRALFTEFLEGGIAGSDVYRMYERHVD